MQKEDKCMKAEFHLQRQSKKQNKFYRNTASAITVTFVLRFASVLRSL